MPSTRKSSGKCSTSSSVRRPTEPVTPSTVSRFMRQGPRVGCVVEEHRDVDEQAVDPVEHAAVTGDEPPGVLGADAPLDRGLHEVAGLADHAQQQLRPRIALSTGERGKNHARAPSAAEHRDRELGHRALHRLARADGRGQLVPPERGARPVGRGLAQPGDRDQEQDPLHAA